MAAKKKEEKEEKTPEPQKLPEPSYPAIEGFVEKATAEDIAASFQDLKDQLAGLKGPKAEHAKKVAKAIARTEELLSHLLQVREKLEGDRKGKGKAKK